MKRTSVVYAWYTKPYSLILVLCILFVLTCGVTFFIGYEQYENSKSHTLLSDRTTANLLSDLVTEHEKAASGILQSYALRQLFINAVEKWDSVEIARHVASLKENNDEIDRVFVTDEKGILRANYPSFKESVGVDLSYQEWYKGVSKELKPYVSAVFKMIVAEKELALAVCVPIINTRGKVIGILGNSQGITFFRKALQQIPLDTYQKVVLIDQAGQVIYSNTLPYTGEVYNYPQFPVIQQAVRERTYFMERKDPHAANNQIYTTLAPLNGIGWTVIIESNSRDMLRADLRHVASTALFSFLFFSIISLVLFSMRKTFLLRETTALLTMEKNLKEEKEKFVELFESIGSGVAVYEARNDGKDFIFKEYNAAAEMLDKTPREQAIGRSVVDVFPGVKDFGLFDVFQRVYRTGKAERHPPTFYKDEKISGWRENYVYKLSSGEVVAIYDDITQRKQAEALLQESEERYRMAIEHSNDGVALVEGDQHIYVNQKFLEMFGYEKLEDVVGKPPFMAVHPDDREMVLEYNRKRQRGEPVPSRYEFKWMRKDGTTLFIEVSAAKIAYHGKPVSLVYLRDMTERKHMEEELHKMSIVDELTGLYNRRGFITLAQQQMKMTKRTKKNMLLFFVDLDDMKKINDTLGHHEGDNALIEVATILKEVFRESDITGRMGGDEFAVLTIDTTDETREVLMKRLRTSIETHNRLEARNYTLSLSIGIACYNPDTPSTLDGLMAQADSLMYEEKRNKQHYDV